MPRWKPPQGCICVDEKKEVHPEPGVYDFSKFRRAREVDHEMEEANWKDEVVRRIFYGSAVDAVRRRHYTVTKRQFELKPEPLRWMQEDLAEMVQNVDVFELNANTYASVVEGILNTIGPFEQSFLCYVSREGDIEKWNLSGYYTFYGVEHGNSKNWLQIKTKENVWLVFKRDFNFEFAFDQGKGFYVRDNLKQHYVFAKF
jgi:hypothetical protein